MKNILFLLIVLVVIGSVQSYGWGFSYYGGNSFPGDYPSFNPGAAIAGAVLGRKK